MAVRLKNQARTIINEMTEPTNLLEPNRLTQVEQSTLKEIFKFIKDFQSTIRMEFKL
jgi:signal-transduction protein with cAMP-binding, CBS, and nucleotidyltransferase domain